jgi:hypothetical protein
MHFMPHAISITAFAPLSLTHNSAVQCRPLIISACLTGISSCAGRHILKPEYVRFWRLPAWLPAMARIIDNDIFRNSHTLGDMIQFHAVDIDGIRDTVGAHIIDQVSRLSWRLYLIYRLAEWSEMEFYKAIPVQYLRRSIIVIFAAKLIVPSTPHLLIQNAKKWLNGAISVTTWHDVSFCSKPIHGLISL